MSTSAETPRLAVERQTDQQAAIRLTGIGVRFEMPAERIPSFKEYILRRLTGSIEKFPHCS